MSPGISRGEPIPPGEEPGDRWQLLLAFDTDEPEFTRGFQVGEMWAECSVQGWSRQTVTGRNVEMVMRVAEAKGLPFSAIDLGHDWFGVTIGEPA